MIYGYLEHHVNYEKPYFDGLKQWLKNEPDSFMFLSENKKQGRDYYFPNGSIDDFKEVMSQSLKEYPKHLKVLDDYCIDWSLSLEKSENNEIEKSEKIDSNSFKKALTKVKNLNLVTPEVPEIDELEDDRKNGVMDLKSFNQALSSVNKKIKLK